MGHGAVGCDHRVGGIGIVAKDQRLYGKFTLSMPGHPKIAILSDAAFRCLVEATLWSREQETDGVLARRYALARWSLEALQELCENDPEKPSLIPIEGGEKGWLIHDYAEHQDTKADVEARRERNRIAGQKGGLAKSKQGAKQTASAALSENVAEEEEENITTTAKAVVGARKRATQLPADFMPPTDVINAMKAECPHVDLQREHRKFIDHFIGNGKPMKDWPAAWRNWIRRAAEHQPTRNGAPNTPRTPASDAAFAQAQALKTKPAGRLEIV